MAKRIIIVLLLLLLTSCSHMRGKDGPPGFYVDESKISNAVPKVEPLSRSGNMPFYRVFGKRYYTLRSSRNYNQIGIASWYGTQFHKRSTSSGERYNMLAMTAAHKTLPLPTYVEVTNLFNHRKVIVKVNDRGPFESNRLIDLSYVAAKKLGMIGHGTAQVRVKAIDPLTYNKPIRLVRNKCPLFPATRQLYFQVGQFHNKSNAIKFRYRLMTLLKVPVQIAMPRNGNKRYYVRIGPIKDLYTADRVNLRLRNLGIKSNKAYGVS